MPTRKLLPNDTRLNTRISTRPPERHPTQSTMVDRKNAVGLPGPTKRGGEHRVEVEQRHRGNPEIVLSSFPKCIARVPVLRSSGTLLTTVPQQHHDRTAARYCGIVPLVCASTKTGGPGPVRRVFSAARASRYGRVMEPNTTTTAEHLRELMDRRWHDPEGPDAARFEHERFRPHSPPPNSRVIARAKVSSR